MLLPTSFARQGQRICHLEGHTERETSKLTVWLCEKCQVWGRTSLYSFVPVWIPLGPEICPSNAELIRILFYPSNFQLVPQSNVRVKTKIAGWRCHAWLNTPEQNQWASPNLQNSVDKFVLGWNTEMSPLVTVLLFRYVSHFQTKWFKDLLVPHPGSGQE